MDQMRSEQKGHYRQKFWTEVEARSTLPPELRKVLILETSFALETIHLLTLGYRSCNIHAANLSTAQLAHANRKLGPNRIHVHTGDIATVAALHGPFDVIAYDGCATIATSENCTRIWALHCLCRDGILGATILAKRDGLSPAARRKRFQKALGGHASLFRYVNNRSPMLWGITG
jgi:hypothetical protein